MKKINMFLVSTFCLIAAASVIPTRAHASQQDRLTIIEPAINRKRQAEYQPILDKNINSCINRYILKEILSHQSVYKNSGAVCRLWEELRDDQFTNFVIHFKYNPDLLNYPQPLLKHPKSRFKISCNLSPQELAQFVHRVKTMKYLNLSMNRSITDVSALGSVHTLDLSSTNVTDVSALGHVHILNLNNTNVTDVSALGSVHTLNLINTQVKDVSALGRVNSLNLSRTHVTDVSALGNVHSLDLFDTQVKDVSALGNVHSLDLWDTQVTDVSALGNVHTLNLWKTKVTDVSALDKVSRLTLPNGEIVIRR